MSQIIYHLPSYYLKSEYVKNITNAFSNEIQKLLEYCKNTKKQFIVDTADYALVRYEEEFGLPIFPQEITIDERRSRIKSRMRVAGTVTKKMIENVIESWSNAEVSITENYSEYEVIVEFIDLKGIPTNIQDVYDAVREIIPAHLGISYKFKYKRHEELKPNTHQSLKPYTHKQIREAVF